MKKPTQKHIEKVIEQLNEELKHKYPEISRSMSLPKDDRDRVREELTKIMNEPGRRESVKKDTLDKVQQHISSKQTNISFSEGIDLLRPAPGTVDKLYCKACNALMHCERNNYPTVQCFASALTGSNKPHDKFTCPYTQEDWHNQVVCLILERNKTNSRRLTDIYNEEIKEILISKKVTKEK